MYSMLWNSKWSKGAGFVTGDKAGDRLMSFESQLNSWDFNLQAM